MFLIVEAVRQLRGQAGETQVPGARIAVAHGTGGMLSTGATLVFDGAPMSDQPVLPASAPPRSHPRRPTTPSPEAAGRPRFPTPTRPLTGQRHVRDSWWSSAASRAAASSSTGGRSASSAEATCRGWMRAGEGTVASFTVIRQNYSRPFRDWIPYVVALVDLEEGPRLMTNIVGCDPDDVVDRHAGGGAVRGGFRRCRHRPVRAGRDGEARSRARWFGDDEVRRTVPTGTGRRPPYRRDRRRPPRDRAESRPRSAGRSPRTTPAFPFFSSGV